MSYESYFDAKVRTVGNSKIITIPINTIEKLGLADNMFLEVGVKRAKSEAKRKNINRMVVLSK